MILLGHCPQIKVRTTNRIARLNTFESSSTNQIWYVAFLRCEDWGSLVLYLFAGGWFLSNTRLKSRTGPQNPMELDYI